MPLEPLQQAKLAGHSAAALKSPYEAALVQLELAQIALSSGDTAEAARAADSAWCTLEGRSGESHTQLC